MNRTQTIIDLEFGTTQLSGNKRLLLTLLQKFTDEYRQTEQKLNTAFKNEDWESARVLVHTLKGVTGNLGINALHDECKQIEDSLKLKSEIPSNYAQFLSILRETLDVTAKLSANPDSDSTVDDSNASSANQSKEDFLRALRNSEFITEEQLDSWVKATTNDTAKQKSIKDAVDELDYQTAINLVNA
ncbi:Hpt domain-containing protein [Alteromonas ponticola]|uniref:Hpt domain-containing protein n=1 Tax=Alteromonas ponticola TaxID=2720613 RepID=A0ABX1R0F0_9ALTE|nr:Hpt domain-containing protein [Alteromonas ponticola]NMH59544.1 Hpt domain-containing protein [Alteromonas ponticola]